MPSGIQVASLFATVDLQDKLTPGLANIEGAISGAASRIGEQLSSIGRTMTIGLTLPIIGFGVAAVKSFSDSETATAQLSAVLKSTGGAAGVTAKMATDLASSLQKVTRFSDKTILSAENILLTFTAVGKDIFPEVTKTALDMATALHMDLNSAMMQIGKAIQDPVAGMMQLRREGVNFTKAQQDMVKAMVKAGNVAGAQKFIMAELKKEFGGSAEMAGKTFAGQLDILKNKFDDLLEIIGAKLAPTLEKVISFLSGLIDKVSSASPEVIALGIGFAAFVAALGPALSILGAIATAIGFIASGPIALVIGGIALLATAFTTNFGGIRTALEPIITGIVDLFKELTGAGKTGNPLADIGLDLTDADIGPLQIMQKGIKDFGDTVKGLWDQISPTLEYIHAWFIDDAMPGIVDVINNHVLPVFKDFSDFLVKLWGIVSPSLDNLFTWFKTDALPKVLDFISMTVIPGIGKFVDFLKGIWDAVSPMLLKLADWFLHDALPKIGNALNDFNTGFIQPIISVLKDIWTLVEPYLQKLYDWFITNALPAIKDAIQAFIDNVITPWINTLKKIWDDISPKLQLFADWFHEHLPEIKKVFDETIGAMLKKISDFATGIQNALDLIDKLGKAGHDDDVSGNDLRDHHFFHATGGAVRRGMPGIVGERGPELFIPSANGSIIPNNQITSGGGGNSGPSIIHIMLDGDGFVQHIYHRIEEAF